jgi:hypothetical protein
MRDNAENVIEDVGDAFSFFSACFTLLVPGDILRPLHTI